MCCWFAAATLLASGDSGAGDPSDDDPKIALRAQR